MKDILWKVPLTQPHLLNKSTFFCNSAYNKNKWHCLVWKKKTFWERTTNICPESKKSKNEYHKN